MLDPADLKFLEDGGLGGDLEGQETKPSQEIDKSTTEAPPLKDIPEDRPIQKTGEDVKAQEESDEEEEEVLFDATELDLTTSTPQEEKRLTQIDLDNLRNLDEQLIAEFDCLA
ncbi:MAG: hypothetical protein HRT72_10910 [Flavobacteriales bacterium]|nr:hypothetical protein [Flavobacteriales bacterium]